MAMVSPGRVLKSFGAAAGSVPTAPTLAITDQEDGTGFTATISGSDAGTTNEVWYQSVDGDIGTSTWTSGGSRTGNGTVDVAVSAGAYWLHVVSTASGCDSLSNFVYAFATASTDAIFYQLLTAVKSRIQTLALTGISSSKVIVRKVPSRRELTPPGVILSPTPEQMNRQEGTNLRDDVKYGVLVTYLAAGNQDLTTDLDKQLLWRERIAKAFRNQRITGITGADIHIASVEPGQTYLPAAFDQGYDAGALVLRCVSREGRGF